MSWLRDQIRQAAGRWRTRGQIPVRFFRRAIDERLAELPLTEWETLFWTRGLNAG
ncbi:MAG: hypothetical protein IPP68_08710 [Elusimicrobia bacterium]|nr:hypothetical protein [Elusimicrobiota bacterium]